MDNNSFYEKYLAIPNIDLDDMSDIYENTFTIVYTTDY